MQNKTVGVLKITQSTNSPCEYVCKMIILANLYKKLPNKTTLMQYCNFVFINMQKYEEINHKINNDLWPLFFLFQLLGILCMALASPAILSGTHWFLFVAVTSFIATLLWVFVYLLGIREVLNLPINWILTVSLRRSLESTLIHVNLWNRCLIERRTLKFVNKIRLICRNWSTQV